MRQTGRESIFNDAQRLHLLAPIGFLWCWKIAKKCTAVQCGVRERETEDICWKQIVNCVPQFKTTIGDKLQWNLLDFDCWRGSSRTEVTTHAAAVVANGGTVLFSVLVDGNKNLVSASVFASILNGGLFCIK